MNRENNIGLRNGYSLFTVYCLLFAGFMLFFAPCVMAADKLIVKDSEGTTKFVVQDDGHLSIGSDTPLRYFHVSTATLPKARFQWSDTNTNAGIEFYENTTYMGGVEAFSSEYVLANWRNAIILTAAKSDVGKIIFRTKTSNIYYERMTIDNLGNVSIGTITAQGSLNVNGPIFQRGGLLYADYVFEPEYKIESIDEHAKYMWKQKHLKALARARKDENGGEIIELGSHQRGIIEELEKAHIYIEQLHERMNALESQLKVLTGTK